MTIILAFDLSPKGLLFLTHPRVDAVSLRNSSGINGREETEGSSEQDLQIFLSKLSQLCFTGSKEVRFFKLVDYLQLELLLGI